MKQFLLGFIALIMCAMSAQASMVQDTNSVATPANPDVSEHYTLGAGDRLRVIVYGEEDLSGEFVVDGSGTVSLPLIGQIRAATLNLRAFENEIVNALSDGYLNDPRVSVEVLNYRPFYILGEVEEPGEFPYTSGLTVMNAVATAGGFTYRANTRMIYIQRAGSDREEQMPLTAVLQVQPGDTIRVAERFF